MLPLVPNPEPESQEEVFPTDFGVLQCPELAPMNEPIRNFALGIDSSGGFSAILGRPEQIATIMEAYSDGLFVGGPLRKHVMTILMQDYKEGKQKLWEEFNKQVQTATGEGATDSSAGTWLKAMVTHRIALIRLYQEQIKQRGGVFSIDQDQFIEKKLDEWQRIRNGRLRSK